ncbi:MAG: hypothetical protein ACFFCQ_07505 [Promethearchaeota archaeon]
MESFGGSKEVEIAMKNAEVSPRIPVTNKHAIKLVKKTVNLRMYPPSEVYSNVCLGSYKHLAMVDKNETYV